MSKKRTHHPLVDFHKLTAGEDDKRFNLRCRPKRKVERQVNVLIKNLAIFFPSKTVFRSYSIIPNSAIGIFSPKTEGAKTARLY